MARAAERGWSRSRARDAYDPGRMLGAFGDLPDLKDFGPMLRAKCATRGAACTGLDDFFQEGRPGFVAAIWHQWLGPLAPTQHSCEKVTSYLRSQIEESPR